MGDLEDYAEYSHSSILYLILESMGIGNDESTNYLASHIGVASGISRLLRGYIYHSSKREVYLPQDVLVKHNLSYKTIFGGPPKSDIEKKALKDCIFDVASQGFGHLDRAREIHMKNGGRMPSGYVRAVGLAASAPAQHFELLRAADFDPFHPSAMGEQSQVSYLVSLFKTIAFNRM